MITLIWTHDADDEDAPVYRVHHNGDWSGDVIITRDDTAAVTDPGTGDVTLSRSVNVTLPFALLRAVVAEAVRSHILAQVETASDAELLGLDIDERKEDT